MAGLAAAAGESENALTNVAKGLMVGLSSFGKDIGEIDAQEAEERKEYRSTLRSLIKDKKDENIATATAKNNFNYRMADLNQRRDQFETEQDYKNAELEQRKILSNQQAEISIVSALANLEVKELGLDIQRANLALQAKKVDLSGDELEYRKQHDTAKLAVDSLKNQTDFKKKD